MSTQDINASAQLQDATAKSPRRVVIRKSGNLIELSANGISPLQDSIRRLLEPMLRYDKKKLLYGRDRYNHSTGAYDRRIDIIPKKCYRYDTNGRLITNFGYAYRLVPLLQQAGYEVDVINKDPEPQRTDYDEINMEAVLRHFEFRQRQDECLQQIIDNPCGVIHAATGFGKLVLIAMVCLAFPNAKIDVVTRRATLVNKITKYLTRYVPNVGQTGGGGKTSGRVTVYTFKSLHHSDFDSDLVLVDEAHEGMADEASSLLARYQNSRMFAFTASPTGRLDGTDIRLEAIFGRTIFYLPYREALKLGLVVPIRVEWSDVKLRTNPCAGLEDVRRKRAGIWRNIERNEIIAAKAKTFNADDQVFVAVDFVEHAVHLWQQLKNEGYVLVYDKMDDIDLKRYKHDGLLPSDYKPMTPKLKEHYREEFEAGRLKKAISTVWDVGVDPVHLTALIRADAGDSDIDDTQIPGRAARISKDNPGKVGIVCDFRDQFDDTFAKRAKSRLSRYIATGWENVVSLPTGEFAPMR
jgi:superfamily II DNA or RNA helicase